jgi:hypothetical protein
VDVAFIAKTAVYAREGGYMKDMPALLVALLSTLQAEEFAPAFRRAIENGKMLRNFVQIMRSGAVGRTSLGTRPKRLVEEWLAAASDRQIMHAAVGQNPSWPSYRLPIASPVLGSALTGVDRRVVQEALVLTGATAWTEIRRCLLR